MSTMMGNNKELVRLHYYPLGPAPKITREDATKALGFPWHESLHALALSAKSGACSLCILVQDAVDIWMEHHREAVETKVPWTAIDAEEEPIPHGSRLWLTRRFHDSPGFLVLARGTSRHSSLFAYLLAAVGFSVQETDQVAAPRFLVTPDLHSGSRKSLDCAASWVKECVDKHDDCGFGEFSLPTRVLDVTLSAGDGGDMIRLVETTSSLRGLYVALSYTWGSSEANLTTTRESYQARVAGFAKSHLPQTIQDAVTIARHLGIPYLWVDSLCIVQDDGDDWAREASRMMEVYMGAHLVVAADRAQDCNGGCFHVREPLSPNTTILQLPAGQRNARDSVSVDVRLLHPSNECHDRTLMFNLEPLSTRGWALQEQLVAERVLHYTSSQMAFECNQGIVGESGCRRPERICKLPRSPPQSEHEHGGDGDGTTTAADGHATWYDLVSRFGLRKLTKPTDMLPAMAGLARRVSPRMSGEYVAGLWSGDGGEGLLDGLAWTANGDQGPASATEYCGPSWSWASFGGSVGFVGLDWPRRISRVVTWHAPRKNPANPFGEVREDTFIVVRGPVAELSPSSVPDPESEAWAERYGGLPNQRFYTKYADDDAADDGGPIHHIVWLDNEETLRSGRWRDWKLYVLLLKATGIGDGAGEALGDKDHPRAYGLVLTHVREDGESAKMRRVGCMILTEKEMFGLMEDDEAFETLTLV